MRAMKLFLMLAIAGLVSACADARIASRNAPYEPVNPVGIIAAPSLAVADIRVQVPKSLRVSEANTYYPSGDIVWRGEPLGDRHQQVAQMMYDGFMKGAENIKGAYPVSVLVDLIRFHGLTEKARYTTGGVHNIVFAMTLIDPTTGAPVRERKVIQADLRALGGLEAIAADGQGQTQKVRITNHLARVIQDELTKPEGHENARLGLLQQINRL